MLKALWYFSDSRCINRISEILAYPLYCTKERTASDNNWHKMNQEWMINWCPSMFSHSIHKACIGEAAPVRTKVILKKQEWGGLSLRSLPRVSLNDPLLTILKSTCERLLGLWPKESRGRRVGTWLRIQRRPHTVGIEMTVKCEQLPWVRNQLPITTNRREMPLLFWLTVIESCLLSFFFHFFNPKIF